MKGEPETLRGSGRSEKSLSKEKNKRVWSRTATLEDASSDGFILACAATERSKECAAQKRPASSERKQDEGSGGFLTVRRSSCAMPVGMRTRSRAAFAVAQIGSGQRRRSALRF